MKQLLLTLGLLAAACVAPALAVDTSPDSKTPAKPAVVTTASPQVLVVTSMGNFTIELNAERAPLTVANFLAFAPDGLTSLGGYPGDEEKATALFPKASKPPTRILRKLLP